MSVWVFALLIHRFDIMIIHVCLRVRTRQRVTSLLRAETIDAGALRLLYFGER